MVLTPYDLKLFARSAAFGLLLCALTLVVMVATDGATTDHAGKAARMAAFAPLLGAIGGGMARVQAQLRGEPVALQSIGVSYARTFSGALVGALLIGLAGAGALATELTDLNALLPTLREPSWVPEGVDDWRSRYDGVVLRGATLQFDFVAPEVRVDAAVPSRGPIVAAVAATALALLVWLARPARAALRIVVGFGAVAATVAVFHFVAARRCNGWMLLAGPGLLLAHVALDELHTRARRVERRPALALDRSEANHREG